MTSETFSYEAYLRSLHELRIAPEKHRKEMRSVAETYDQSVGLANDSVKKSEERCERGDAAIQRHLQNATSFLTRIDESSRIPPRIRPSVIPRSAAGAEVDIVIQQLADTTRALGVAVERLVASPRQPMPQSDWQPVQQSSEKPRRSFARLLTFGGIAATALILVVIMAIVLTH